VALAITMAVVALFHFKDGTIVLSMYYSLGEDKAGENEL